MSPAHGVIPLVDMQAPTAPAHIRGACLDTGFFSIVGHGAPQALIDGQFAQVRRFFALDQVDKLAVHSARSVSGNGYDPALSQALQVGAAADLKESFHCGPELPADHPYVRRGLPRYGGNQWPAGLPEFRAQSLAYFDAMADLGRRLMSLVALSLDLDAGYFAPFHRQPMADLRLLHYPPSDPADQTARLGAGAHTDWGGLTILAQDQVGGLEVMTLNGEWIAAPPIPGAFVVNLGQLMARWTNDLYRANLHRVVAMAPGRRRYSIPFFFNPDFDAVIEALPGCAGPDRPPLWPPCTAGQHIEEMRQAAMRV